MKKSMPVIVTVFAAMTATSVHAATACESLKKFAMKNVTITMAQDVGAGEFTLLPLLPEVQLLRLPLLQRLMARPRRRLPAGPLLPEVEPLQAAVEHLLFPIRILLPSAVSPRYSRPCRIPKSK